MSEKIKDFLKEIHPMTGDTMFEFFKEYLYTGIGEGESFSSKRPICDSGWEWDIEDALKKHKVKLNEVVDYIFSFVVLK